jgi:hypothetical protein
MTPKSSILSRTAEITLRYLCKFLGKFIWYLGMIIRVLRMRKSNSSFGTIVPVGEAGGKSIFFEELVSASNETFGAGHLMLISIDKKRSFFKQINERLILQGFNSIFMDTRTFSRVTILLILQMIEVVLFCAIKDIRVTCLLTDASLVKHRLAAIFLTAKSGYVVTFLLQSELARKIPHKRIVGGALIPISKQTIKELEFQKREQSRSRLKGLPLRSTFVGSLYPERMELLAGLNGVTGLEFRTVSKNLGLSNENYWRTLTTSDIVIVTTAQTNIENNWIDLHEYNQVTFRIGEVFASGSALVCQKTQGLELDFIAGVHYFEFIDSESLKSLVLQLIKEPSKIDSVAENGHLKFLEVNRHNKILRKICEKHQL